MKKKETELTFTQKLSKSIDNIFRNHKKIVIAVAAAIVVAIVAIVVVAITIENKNDALFVALDTLEADYAALADGASDEFVASANELIEKGGNKYPGYKAKYVLADYYFENENYTEALALYEDVAKVASKTYLAPIALLNAAASAENAGDQDKALDLYAQIGTEKGESSKALFNIARIYEAKGNIEAAKANYQQLVDDFSESEYAALAKNRLLVL